MPDPAVEPDWPVWLASEDVPSDAKAARLALHVASHGALPEGCDLIWTETARLATAGRGGTAVLLQLFQRLDARQLTQLLGRTPEIHLRSIFGRLIVATSQDESLTAVLSQFVSAVDEDQLGPLLRGLGPLTGLYPAGELELGRRLLAMLHTLPDRPERFRPRLATLRAGARFLPGGHDRVRAWRQFQDAFEVLAAACQSKGRGRFGARIPAEMEDALRNAGATLAEAMPADCYPDDAQANSKRRLLDALLAQCSVPVTALPDNFSSLLAQGFANPAGDLRPRLQLWDADEEAAPANSAAVPVLAQSAEWCSDKQSPPGDDPLFRFLFAPAEKDSGRADSPPLPERWQLMAVEDRRRRFCQALAAYLQACAQERTALTLVVEPEIGPLFVYGIARLLPQPWRSRLRCSPRRDVGEPLPARSGEGDQGGATPDAKETPPVLLDTWVDHGSAPSGLASPYAQLALDDLLPTGQIDAAQWGARIDRWLQPWEQDGVKRISELQELALGEIAARRILGITRDPSDLSWTKSPLARAHVRRRIRNCLSTHPDATLLDWVAQSPEHLRVVLRTGLEADGDIACRTALRSLVERVESLERLDELLGSSPAGRSYKLYALQRDVAARQRLPVACGWLWRERPSGSQDANQPLLFDLLKHPAVTQETIRASLDTVPAEGLGLLFCGVLTTQAGGAAKQELLDRIAARPDLDLFQLLEDFGHDLLIHVEEDAGNALARRIEQQLDQLHRDPRRVASLSASLETAKRLCEDSSGHPGVRGRIKAWRELLAVFQAQRTRAAQPAARMLTKVGVHPASDLRFAEQICACLDRAYPQETHEAFRSREAASLAALAAALAKQYGLADLLPEGFPKLLSLYFRRGPEGLCELRKHHQAQAVRLFVKHPAFIATACLLLVLTLAGVLVSSRGCRSSSTGVIGRGESSGTLPHAGAPLPRVPGDASANIPSEPPLPASEAETLRAGDGASKDKDAMLPARGPETSPTPSETAADVPNETLNSPAPAGGAVILATPPLHGICEASASHAVELYRGPPVDACSIHLHGKALLLSAPGPAEIRGVHPLGPVQRVEFKPAAGRLEVSLQFQKLKRLVTIATFSRAAAGSVLHGTLAPVPSTPDGYAERVRDLLQFCVIELRPVQAGPSTFVGLTKPGRAVFRLDASGEAVVSLSSAIPSRELPGQRRYSELYLGQGRLTHPSGQTFEFGGDWLQDAQTKEWPVLRLTQALGFDRGSVELAAGRQDPVLELSVSPTRFQLLAQQTEELRTLEARKERIESLSPSDPESSALLGIPPVNPPGPRPRLVPAKKKKNPWTGKIEVDTESLTRNMQQMEAWKERNKASLVWESERLSRLQELQREIGHIEARYRNPLAMAAAREAAYKSWLEAKPEIQASIYRLVPHDSGPPEALIRVLVTQCTR